ncbi:MAG: hypothetical protein LUQ54_07030 [Methanoregula sp.]|nr:hypothetical protein [Methanoregula sp.]
MAELRLPKKRLLSVACPVSETAVLGANRDLNADINRVRAIMNKEINIGENAFIHEIHACGGFAVV